MSSGDFIKECELTLSTIKLFYERLLNAPSIAVEIAVPPERNGVYAFSFEGEIVYVGEAAGSSGLKDRILRKHVSGDEGHSLQREFMTLYPDRLLRRSFIKKNIFVQWVEIPDSLIVAVVEKFAINILKPRLNRAVRNQTER